MKLASLISLAAGLCGALLAVGCEKVFDGGQDCPPTFRMHFVYDYNMLRTDAAPSQVEAVELRIFDKEGAFLRSFKASGTELHAAGMSMDLDLAPGEYSYVALGWSGVLESCYDVAASETLQAQTVGMKGDGHSDPVRVGELLPLFHGHGKLSLPADSGSHVYECSFIKDFNDVKIVLQNLSGEPLRVEDFSFSISDENAVIGPDNVPLAGGRVLYSPVLTSTGSSQVLARSATKASEGNLLLSEFTLGRLWLGQQEGAILRVNGPEGALIRLPLAESFLLVKGYYNQAMPDQEFLDRMDDFSLTLFLQGGSWVSASLIINSWKVVINNDDF